MNKAIHIYMDAKARHIYMNAKGRHIYMDAKARHIYMMLRQDISMWIQEAYKISTGQDHKKWGAIYHSLNTKYTEQRKSTKSLKRKTQGTYKGKSE